MRRRPSTFNFRITSLNNLFTNVVRKKNLSAKFIQGAYNLPEETKLADDKSTDVQGGLRLAADFFGSLTSEVILLGGQRDDILKLAGPDRFKLTRKIAELIVGKPLTAPQETAKRAWDWPLEELELPVYVQNKLLRKDIRTIGGLVSKSVNDLAALPNFGKKSIGDIEQVLALHGLELGTLLPD